jgi:hypothetical protein
MGQVALCGREGTFGFLVRKPEENRIPKRPSRRRENNIRIDFQSVGWGKCVLNLPVSGFKQVIMVTNFQFP